MFSIADSMNTHNACLLAIESKGYDVVFIPAEEDEEFGDWHAKKSTQHFYADDPIKLLGLIAMIEHRGEDWQRKSFEINLREKILDEAFDD